MLNYLADDETGCIIRFVRVRLASLALSVFTLGCIAMCGVSLRLCLDWCFGACVKWSTEAVFCMLYASMAAVHALASRMRYGPDARRRSLLLVLFAKT